MTAGMRAKFVHREFTPKNKGEKKKKRNHTDSQKIYSSNEKKRHLKKASLTNKLTFLYLVYERFFLHTLVMSVRKQEQRRC